MAVHARNSVIKWLLDGDPSIRWQVMRDLADAAQSTILRERGKIAKEGWGSRLLARQDPEGTWAGGKSSDGGLYSPKWISTTYTMLLLRDLGLPPKNKQAQKACKILLDEGMQRDGGINYGWRGRSETCVTGMLLSIFGYFQYNDDRLDTIVDHLLANQMDDGGWNCQRPYGATHSSVHTTISVLEGLRIYEGFRRRKVRAIKAAQRRGREFLLIHRLFRSHRTGKVIKPIFLKLSFPPRWHFDILRGLDHFQTVNAPRDHRLTDAIDIILEKRKKNKLWQLENSYKGKVYFQLERVGTASRWNTLRAMRVLRWWEDGKNRSELIWS